MSNKHGDRKGGMDLHSKRMVNLSKLADEPVRRQNSVESPVDASMYEWDYDGRRHPKGTLPWD